MFTPSSLVVIFSCESQVTFCKWFFSDRRTDWLTYWLTDCVDLLLTLIVWICCWHCWQGLQRIKDEIADVEEPLIDPVHGHGRCVISHSRYLFSPGFCQTIYCYMLHIVPCFVTVDLECFLCVCVCVTCSQSLINLLLTGKAVSHVWDNEKSVSGLSK